MDLLKLLIKPTKKLSIYLKKGISSKINLQYNYYLTRIKINKMSLT